MIDGQVERRFERRGGAQAIRVEADGLDALLLEPADDALAIGSGGSYAYAAALAYLEAGSYEHQGDLGTATYRVSGNYAGLQLHSSDGRVLLEQSLRGTDFSRGLLQFNKVRGDGLQTLNQTRIWFSR